MTGASSTLAESGEKMSSGERTALAQSVYRQARDMADQVSKILQMTRLEAGGIEVDFDWASISEIIGSAMARLSERLAQHRVVVDIPRDLPLVRIDATLIEQALVNLLENIGKYTPPETQIVISAHAFTDTVELAIADDGPGFSEDPDRLFQKFYRGDCAGPIPGAGLGLAICRAILEAHQGHIHAERAVPHGAGRVRRRGGRSRVRGQNEPP